MSPSALALVTFWATLGAGLVAGAFFAFSTFIMAALFRLPAAQGVAAMQSINIVVINPWFMGALFGTGLPCLLLIASSLLDWSAPGAALRLGGGALYLVGTVLVTIACNVPLNDALAAFPAESAGAASLWPRYVRGWTMWNHVRTGAALSATVLLSVALRVR